MITHNLKNVGYLINIFISLLFTEMVVPVMLDILQILTREGDYPLAEEIRFFLMSAITCLTIKHHERVLMSPWDNS